MKIEFELDLENIQTLAECLLMFADEGDSRNKWQSNEMKRLREKMYPVVKKIESQMLEERWTK